MIKTLIDLAEEVFGFDINFDAVQAGNYQPPELNPGSRKIKKFDFAENNDLKIFAFL